jgi:hypothetical protein
VEFSGSSTPPSADQFPAIGLTIDPADGRSEGPGTAVRGRVESNGQFTTMGVPPGRYLLRVTAPSGWALRGAMVNGQDAADVPIELRDGDAGGVVITFTDRRSDLSGSVMSPAGQPDAGAAVIVFPVDRGVDRRKLGSSALEECPKRKRWILRRLESSGRRLFRRRRQRCRHGGLAKCRVPRGAVAFGDESDDRRG